MKISSLSQNNDGVVFLDARTEPIVLTGLYWAKENGNYHRLPDSYNDRYSEGVRSLSGDTAGATLRFRTDAACVSLRVKAFDIDDDTNMSRDGAMGLDVYTGDGWGKTFAGLVRAPRTGDTFEGTVTLPGTMTDVTVNLPLYAGVSSLEVGFPPEAELLPPTPYPVEKPVAFYGSSITQGGSASRPGNCYQAMLSRTLGFEVLNYGFSGNARGETLLAELIGSIPLSAFVMAYDHNAPTPEFLAETHEPFFLAFREKQPDTPVILLSRADGDVRPEEDREARRAVIEKTYANAIARGDKNVWFVDGTRVYGTVMRDACTVDGTHPSDLGFFRFYETLLPIFRRILCGSYHG